MKANRTDKDTAIDTIQASLAHELLGTLNVKLVSMFLVTVEDNP